MKVLLYLAALLAGLAYSVGLVAWLLPGVSDLSPAVVLLMAQAPTAFVSAAWLAGTGRYLGAGAPGAPQGRWWRRAGVAVAVYAVVLALLPPAVTGAPLAGAAVVLGSGIALVAAGTAGGSWIARRQDNAVFGHALRMPTAERQLAMRGAVVAASSQAIFWVSLLQSDPVAGVGPTLLASIQLALFGTGVAALAAGIQFRDRILHDARVNPHHARLLHRVVCKGAGMPSEDGLRHQAIRYAVAIPYLSFFNMLYIPLIFLSTAVQRLGPGMSRPSLSAQLIGVGLAVALVLVSVHYARQERAGVRFARKHTVLPSGGPD